MTVFAGDVINASDINQALDKRIGTTPAVADGTATSGTTELVVDTLTVNVVAGRTYHLKAYFPFQGSVAADRFLIRLREGTTTAGSQITYDTGTVDATGAVFVAQPESDWTAASTGSQSFCVTAQRNSGTGTLTPKGAPSQTRLLTLEYVEG